MGKPVFKIFWVVVVFTAAAGLALSAGPVRSRAKSFGKVVRLSGRIGMGRLGVCRCSPDENMRIRREDGIELAANRYGGGGPGLRPGVLLLHGNTPYGKRLAVYRVLSEKLSERGYIVLNLDFAGYGESDDPFRMGRPESVELNPDVRAALKYMETVEGLDRGRIHIAGHSMGAGPAMDVGAQEPSVRTVIAIGPPRRWAERSMDSADMDYFWKRAIRTRRQVYHRPFPEWYTRDIWLDQAARNNVIDRHIETFSGPSHKPLLLIDGGREDEKDREYLKRFFDRISEPKEYVTVSGSDHYLNSLSWGGWVFYDRAAVGRTVDAMDRWITRFSDHPDVEAERSNP